NRNIRSDCGLVNGTKITGYRKRVHCTIRLELSPPSTNLIASTQLSLLSHGRQVIRQRLAPKCLESGKMVKVQCPSAGDLEDLEVAFMAGYKIAQFVLLQNTAANRIHKQVDLVSELMDWCTGAIK